MKILSRVLKTALLVPLVACSPQLSNSGKDTAGEKLSPEFIAPQEESIRAGLAGDAPADIARYLMARGAGPTALSPDSTRVAYQSSITGQPQLYVMAKSGGAAQQLTFGNGVTFFHWTPNGQALVYGADNDGNEQESYYIISADGVSERMLLPAAKGGFRVFGGFSNDGQSIAYASTERNGLDFDIYVADTTTGVSRRIYEGKYGFFVNAVSPDGSKLVVSETVGEDADNLYLLEVTSGQLTTVSKPKSRANHTSQGVVWQADGQAFYFATNKDREFTALSKYTLNSGLIETLYETGADIENITLCGAHSELIAFTKNEDGFDSLHTYALSTKETTTASLLPEGVYSLSCAPGTDDIPGTNDIIVRVNAWNRPGDIYHINLLTLKPTRIYASNYAGLSTDKLVKPVSVHMPARDGVMLQGLLYMPEPNAQGTLPPVVFEVHGGPTEQARPYYNGPLQYLVGNGIAVFQPNVRGSSGFGRNYSQLDDKEKRLDSVRDLIDMLAYLKTDNRVDTSRAAVSGGSYGGYVVNAVLAAYPDAFAAGVSRYSVADWVSALEVASPALKASDIVEYGDISDPYWREFYTENSPIRQADQIKVPVLFSHGVMDPRIDIAETETMVRAVRSNGVDVTYIRIPDEGHGWRKLKNRLFYYRRQTEFLEKHLGVKP
ncbi:MAG: dipeptidyl aminopeptidase [Robiginitomaculum sp.]|nr:MAG: dipeptidyl aminopeptidase [Robiginitomaculum sp.]